MKAKTGITAWIAPHLHHDETVVYLYPEYVASPLSSRVLGGAFGGPMLVAALIAGVFITYQVDIFSTEAQLSIVAMTLAAIAWGTLSIEWFASRGLPMYYVLTDRCILEFRFRVQRGEITEIASQREIPYEKIKRYFTRTDLGLSYLVFFPYRVLDLNRVQIGPLDDPDAVMAFLEAVVKQKNS
ncbi:MAG: hypothetical protein AAF653_18455 [Chloroflexota bacterium]